MRRERRQNFQINFDRPLPVHVLRQLLDGRDRGRVRATNEKLCAFPPFQQVERVHQVARSFQVPVRASRQRFLPHQPRVVHRRVLNTREHNLLSIKKNYCIMVQFKNRLIFLLNPMYFGNQKFICSNFHITHQTFLE